MKCPILAAVSAFASKKAQLSTSSVKCSWFFWRAFFLYFSLRRWLMLTRIPDWTFKDGVIIITSQEANKKSVTLFVNLLLLSDNSRVLLMTRHSILSYRKRAVPRNVMTRLLFSLSFSELTIALSECSLAVILFLVRSVVDRKEAFRFW